MRTSILLGVLCLFTWTTHAQLRTKIDSLENLLKQNSETGIRKVNLLLDIAKTYRGVNLDTCYWYADQAYRIALLAKYEKGIAEANKTKGSSFLFKGEKDSCVFYYQKAQILFQKLGDESGVQDINYNLGLLYVSMAAYDKAIEYYNKDLAYRKEIQDTLGIADGLLNIGSVYLYRGDNENAFANFSSAIPYFAYTGDTLSVAKAQYNLGTIQWNYSNYDLALNNYFSSVQAFEKEGDHYLLASGFENIAGVYNEMEQYEKASIYFRYSLNHSELLGDNRLIAANYHNIGVVMGQRKLKDSSNYYYDKSIAIANRLGFKDILSLNYHSLGILHTEDNPELGIEFFTKSIALKKEITFDNINIASSYQGLGKIYRNQGEYTLARNTLEQGWEISEKTDSKETKSELSLALYDLYKEMGDVKKAMKYLENYRMLKDSIFTEETAKNVVAREIQYETAKKDQQIQLLTKEKELQKAEVFTKEALVKQRSTQRNLLLWTIGSLFVISFLIFRNYRIKLRTRELINKKQQEFVKLRSRFFANISHEFRTPLTLILGPLNDMLSSEKEDQEHKRNYQLMKRNGKKLLDLVNQLLDLAKLESGTMPLRVKEGDIHTFLKTLTASFNSLAAFHHIRFNIQIQPEIRKGWFDENTLEKIINNLLSNAFKFTSESGAVEALAYLSSPGGMRHCITIEVKDNGKGIPSTDLEKIFDRFYQIDVNGTGERSGTGIGLALTKELTELHHGTIGVESEEGKGSKFIITIPINKEQYFSNEIAETEETEPLKSLPLTKSDLVQDVQNDPVPNGNGLPQLLIIEDDKDIRAYISKQLHQAYLITEAVNGQEGFNTAVETIPDLIISDVMMPEMGGMELCEALKKDERTSHVPIILLTALASQNSKLQGIETGADDYIVKPFDKAELRARAKNLIEQRKQLREKYSRQVILEPKAIAITSADERFLEKVIRVLEAQLDNSEFSVEDFGKEIGMSRMQLFRKMKALTNQPVSDFMRDFRLKRAAQLLKNKAGNITEVAYQVGFNNLSYFTKCFRDMFGNTPSEYLKIN